MPLSVGTTRLVNAALYQAGWFACVLGAAGGHGAAGAAIAAGLVGVHVVLSTDRRRDLGVMAVALAFGVATEAGQIAGGTYASLGGAPPNGLPPAWLLLLWVQFGTTFRYGLHPVTTRAWRAALFGAVGGPLAFVAGERVGAVVLWSPVPPVLLGLAVAWSLALAALALTTRVVAGGAPGAYRG